jgi:chemotaxis protein methyltransferase CheR/type IV pilus assembly protein PilK
MHNEDVPAWALSLPDLDEQQFNQWAALLEERVGVVVPEDRKSFLTTGLKLRMREIGCADYQEYYLRMRHSNGAEEWSMLVDRLTVHETRFFRHKPSLRLVAEQVLPKEGAAEGDAHTLQAWSVGCATGEEAYSLAMLIDAHFSALGGRYFFGITGTDVSRPALETARAGVYARRRMADIPLEMQSEYCLPLEGGGFQVHPELRNRVCFAQLNAVQAGAAPYAKMDLIFCQNLLIYFERERREHIANQLAGQLRPGGVLVLGPGELVGWQHPQLERVRHPDTLAFRRLPTAQAKEAS